MGLLSKGRWRSSQRTTSTRRVYPQPGTHIHTVRMSPGGGLPSHVHPHVTPRDRRVGLTSCRPPDILWWSVWLHLVENSSFFTILSVHKTERGSPVSPSGTLRAGVHQPLPFPCPPSSGGPGGCQITGSPRRVLGTPLRAGFLPGGGIAAPGGGPRAALSY